MRQCCALVALQYVVQFLPPCLRRLSEFISTAPQVNSKLGRFISRLNEKHMEYAWVSLIWVALTDVYVRLLAMGVISDLRFF